MKYEVKATLAEVYPPRLLAMLSFVSLGV